MGKSNYKKPDIIKKLQLERTEWWWSLVVNEDLETDFVRWEELKRTYYETRQAAKKPKKTITPSGSPSKFKKKQPK